MDKINILIVEDDPEQSSALKDMLEANDYHVSTITNNHHDTLTHLQKHSVDLLIIDIFLNGIPEGIIIAETIDATPGLSKPFVFLTSATDRKIFEKAKLTNSFSYLLKPYNELEVLYAIEMAIEKFYDDSRSIDSEEADAIIGDK